jgi:hypothetical protein
MKSLDVQSAARSRIAILALASTLIPLTKAVDISPFFEATAGFTYEKALVDKVGNIPLVVRNVPVHPDDQFAKGGQGPIQQDALEPSNRFELAKAKFGLELEFLEKKLSIRTGLSLELQFDTETFSENNARGDMAERDYLGRVGSNQRGTGTALTYNYVGVRYWPNWNSFLRPNVFVEGEYKIVRWCSASIGFKINEQTLFLENGWDRRDELETQDTYKAATYHVLSPYVSINGILDENERTFVRLEGGIQKVFSESRTSLGRQLQIERAGTPLFAGITFGIKF